MKSPSIFTHLHLKSIFVLKKPLVITVRFPGVSQVIDDWLKGLSSYWEWLMRETRQTISCSVSWWSLSVTYCLWNHVCVCDDISVYVVSVSLCLQACVSVSMRLDPVRVWASDWCHVSLCEKMSCLLLLCVGLIAHYFPDSLIKPFNS